MLSNVSGMLFLKRQVPVEFLNWPLSRSIIFTFWNNKSIEVKHRCCVLLHWPASNGAHCSCLKTRFCCASGHMSQLIKRQHEKNMLQISKTQNCYCNSTKRLHAFFLAKTSSRDKLMFVTAVLPFALNCTPSLHWPTLRHKHPAWGHSRSPTPTQMLAGGMDVLSSVQWNLNTTVGQVA